MDPIKIPHHGLARQYTVLKEELLNASHLVLKSGQYVAGHYTGMLESWLRTKNTARHAITVHSGTQALEIMAKAKLDWHKREATTIPVARLPNLTYPATLNAFLSTGWKVELIDTDKFGIMDSEADIKTLPNVDCVVGLFGRKPDLKKFAYSRNLIVDGAQHWLVSGGIRGYGMAISFDPTKNLCSTGNGGAIITDDTTLYNFAINYRDNYKSDSFSHVGTNSKMSEQDCAHVLVRAKYIDEWQDRRTKIASFWCDQFRLLPVRCLNDVVHEDRHTHQHQKFVLYTPERNSLHTELLLEGIESKITYGYTLGDLPTTHGFTKPDLMSTSVMLSRGMISLPIYPELTDSEVHLIAEKVTKFLAHK